MMLTVYKYPLVYGENILSIPAGAKPLAIGEIGEDLVMWALVDTGAAMAFRTFLVTQTGEQISRDESKITYIGTVTMKGWWVGHVFEIMQ